MLEQLRYNGRNTKNKTKEETCLMVHTQTRCSLTGEVLINHCPLRHESNQNIPKTNQVWKRVNRQSKTNKFSFPYLPRCLGKSNAFPSEFGKTKALKVSYPLSREKDLRSQFLTKGTNGHSATTLNLKATVRPHEGRIAPAWSDFSAQVRKKLTR